MDAEESIRDALPRHYAENGLPPDGGAGRLYFFVRLGRLSIPLPNPPMRKRALLYHDLHHLAAGYDTRFAGGEMLIAGYEIGAGCGACVVAWVINLWVLAVGTLVMPRRLLSAFARGRRCDSLYRYTGRPEALTALTVDELRHQLGLDRPPEPPTPADRARFVAWCAVAWGLTLASAALVVIAVWFVAWCLAQWEA